MLKRRYHTVKHLKSKRLAAIKESAIRRIIDLAARQKDVIHLEQGEPSFSTPGHITNAAISAMCDGFTHYGPTKGLPELREAVARKLANENNLPVDGPEDVLVVSGTQEAMFLAALTFLDHGDEALVFEPFYPAYPEETLIAGAKPVVISLSEEEDYEIKFDRLQKYVTDKTKMIWLNSPANPTGHVFSERDLETVARLSMENDLIVFADEIYEKLVYDGAEHVSIGSLPGLRDRVITVNGFSKSYAMAGWRVGYASAQRELLDQMNKLHYYAVLCPSSVAQKAALAALNGPQNCVDEMVREYDERRRVVMDGLKRIGLPYLVPKGAFYVFPDVTEFGNDDEAIAEVLLKEHGVAVVPGSGFGDTCRGHLRISFSTPVEELQEGIRRLQDGFENLASKKETSSRTGEKTLSSK
jgi:aspartate/methionine/tyrosine aminotransferase